MTDIKIDTHYGAVCILRKNDLIYLNTKRQVAIGGWLGLSIDEAMIVGKAILRAAREADKERPWPVLRNMDDPNWVEEHPNWEEEEGADEDEFAGEEEDRPAAGPEPVENFFERRRSPDDEIPSFGEEEARPAAGSDIQRQMHQPAQPPADERAGAPNGEQLRAGERQIAHADEMDARRERERQREAAAGAPIIDAQKLREIVKDYDARHPTVDYTLAKYRTQTIDQEPPL